MKTSNSLTLTDINVWPYAPTDEIAHRYPGYELFDSRRDFLLDPRMKAVAVRMTFFNERANAYTFGPGIRRRLSIAFFDATSGDVISSSEFTINIPRGDDSVMMRADLPFTLRDIDTSHAYRIAVKDTSTGILLADKCLYFFSEKKIGTSPDEWYDVHFACLVTNVFNEEYRSIDAEFMSFQKIRFRIQSKMETDPAVFPEMEIRLHFPDGKQEHKFISPAPTQDCMERFTANIDSKFYVSDSNKGICYAELLCMEYPVAGVVFSTSGPMKTGVWDSEDIPYLPEYSLEAAAERYKRLNPTTEEEEFDQLLDKFIESQKDISDSFDWCDNTDSSDDTDKEETADESEKPEDAENQSESEDSCESEDADIQRESEEPYESEDAAEIEDPLENLTGLTSVKEKLTKYEKLVMFNKLRIDAGLPTPDVPLHAMFLGSPGTGKTTVAKRMGAILHRAGVLSKGHVVVKERSTLLGQYYSSEAENTLKALKEAEGGILFIDEAYQLFQPKDPRDPGKFVIETLLSALTDESHSDWMLILAGYPDRMREMFEMNPGFKSRIPESNIYTFEDFTEAQLMEIAERYLDRKKYRLTDDAHKALASRLAEDHRNRDEKFGNARHVMNMIKTEIIPSMAVRVITGESNYPDALTEIMPVDIPTAGTPKEAAQRSRIGFI